MNNSCLNPPRYGTTVPNRIFVGGITTDVSLILSFVRRQTFGLIIIAILVSLTDERM